MPEELKAVLDRLHAEQTRIEGKLETTSWDRGSLNYSHLEGKGYGIEYALEIIASKFEEAYTYLEDLDKKAGN